MTMKTEYLLQHLFGLRRCVEKTERGLEEQAQRAVDTIMKESEKVKRLLENAECELELLIQEARVAARAIERGASEEQTDRLLRSFVPASEITPKDPHVLTVDELLTLPDGRKVWEEFRCGESSSLERMIKATFDNRIAGSLGISGPALVGEEVYVAITEDMFEERPNFRYWDAYPEEELRRQTKWEGEG